jgi:hypothetical protein
VTSFPILDVAIGLCFFYLLLGLICSTVNEIIAAKWKRRATYLDRGINNLLGGDTKLKELLYKHPLIASLARRDPAKDAGTQTANATAIRPSYIPADKFATALMDILTGEGIPHTNVVALKNGVDNLKTVEIKDAMTALMDGAKMDAAVQNQDAAKSSAAPQGASEQQVAAAIHKKVEAWFNDGMDRVAGWYKRRSQVWNWILAAVVSLVLNADTLHVADVLWTSPTARAAVVQAAAARVEKPPEQALPMVDYPDPQNATASKPVPSSPEDALTEDEKKIVGELTGWNSDCKKLGMKTGGAWIAALLGLIWNHLLGWILTVIAVSMGAPFWFDVLKKFMNVRNDGRKPGDQPKTAPANS